MMTAPAIAAGQVSSEAQVGGAGGGPFLDMCRSGDVLVGYNDISGKAMDTFAAVCQAQRNGVLVGANYGLRTWGQDITTSTSFKAFETPRCPAGAAISALQVYVNKYDQIDSVTATCTALVRGAFPPTFIGTRGANGGQIFRSGQSACRLGSHAVGVVGRYGAAIDALGVRCAVILGPPVLATGPTRPPAPPTPAPRSFVGVLRDVDVYDVAAPSNGDPPKGVLKRGAAGVALVQKGPGGWYRLTWPGAPAGADWVYSAPDFQSLDPATLGH